MKLIVPKSRFGAPQTWYNRMLWVIAKALRLVYPVRIEGAERLPRTGPAVVIAAHMSFSDGFPFLYITLPRPPRFIGTAFFLLGNAPMSWLMFLGGTIPIWKHVPDTQAGRRLLRLLANGELIGLFPEGERSWAGAPLDPILPSVKFLARLKVPVFLAELEGSYDHWPRWDNKPNRRPITVRLTGPIELPAPAEARRTAGRRSRWWDAVYRSGGELDEAAAHSVLAALLRDSTRGEARRLDLLRAGRIEQLAQLICYCPECARPDPVATAQRLACRDCGAAWLPGPGGALKREGAPPEESGQLLTDVFLRMLETLDQRAARLLPLEVPVTVLNHGARKGTAGRVVLNRNGASISADAATWDVDLASVADGELSGMTVIQFNARGGEPLSLRCEGSALRLVLAARAVLGRPWGRFVSAPPMPARDRKAVRA
jgi:1-acyl-sn-glycerol-3-phosphate acyltransferase